MNCIICDAGLIGVDNKENPNFCFRCWVPVIAEDERASWCPTTPKFKFFRNSSKVILEPLITLNLRQNNQKLS